MLVGFVDALFARAYLSGCGLDDDASREHNELVVEALDAVLARWDQFAALMNCSGDTQPEVARFLAMTTGVSNEVVVRLAAYVVLFESLHPVIPCAVLWPRKKGVKAWWEEANQRAATPIRLNGLKMRGALDRNTLRAIRSGKSIPRDDVIHDLSQRLAAHGIKNHRGDRAQTKAEIEFELRVACLVAELFPRYRRFMSRHGGLELRLFDAFRQAMAGSPRNEVIDLLRNGMASSHWKPLEEVARGVAVQSVLSLAMPMQQHADRMLEVLKTDPAAALAEEVTRLEEQVKHLRGLDTDPGADDFGALMAEWLEHMAGVLRGGFDQNPPARRLRPGFDAEFRAAGLCYEALAPWLNHDDATKEKMFRQALKVCPTSGWANRMLGFHLECQGRLDEAVTHLNDAVKLNPANVHGRELLSGILIDMGRSADALEVAEEPGSETLLLHRAAALVRLGRWSEAEPIVERVLAKNPHDAAALEVAAEAKEVAGDKGAAAALRRKAVFYGKGVRR